MDFQAELENMPENDLERITRVLDDLIENGYPKNYTLKERNEFRFKMLVSLSKLFKDI